MLSTEARGAGDKNQANSYSSGTPFGTSGANNSAEASRKPNPGSHVKGTGRRLKYSAGTNIAVLSDPILLRYIDNLKSRNKNTGIDLDGKQSVRISPNTISMLRCTLRHMLDLPCVPDSNHALTDIANGCGQTDTKRRIENTIQAYANTEPITSHRTYVMFFKGVMRRGAGISLMVNADNHFISPHHQIDPLTLRDFYNALKRRQRNIIDLAAYTGERPGGLYSHRLTQVSHINEHHSELDSIKFQNKGGVQHYAILPAP
jgi:hypothetical protein